MANNKIIRITSYTAPCGTLLIGSLDDRLCLCNWQSGKPGDSIMLRLRRILGAEFRHGHSDVCEKAAHELDDYFEGKRRQFDIPLLMAGTEFQERVWRQLLCLPYGSRVSYGEMARTMGMPGAVRALANAAGANAISVFVPCHRVTGSDGSLTGYGGGLEVKRALLILESKFRNFG